MAKRFVKYKYGSFKEVAQWCTIYMGVFLDAVFIPIRAIIILMEV